MIFQEFYDFFVVKSVREYLKNKYAVHFTAEIEAVPLRKWVMLLKLQVKLIYIYTLL